MDVQCLTFQSSRNGSPWSSLKPYNLGWFTVGVLPAPKWLCGPPRLWTRLHVVFEWVQKRWCSRLWAFMFLDDAINAVGSVNHDTMRSVLLFVGVRPILTDLILYAIQHLTLHVGGHHGLRLIRAMYEVGMGQGDPISPLLYCLVNELRVQLILQSAGLITTLT